MILLISHGGEGKPSGNGERVSSGWKRRLWRRLMDWLAEPIPFPGKWPVNGGPSERYNREEHARVHERSAARPRCVTGTRSR
jgi:hypothetical protein